MVVVSEQAAQNIRHRMVRAYVMSILASRVKSQDSFQGFINARIEGLRREVIAKPLQFCLGLLPPKSRERAVRSIYRILLGQLYTTDLIVKLIRSLLPRLVSPFWTVLRIKVR